MPPAAVVGASITTSSTRSSPDDRGVRSYDPVRDHAEYQTVLDQWGNLGKDPRPANPAQVAVQGNVGIEPGQTVNLLDVSGPGQVNAIHFFQFVPNPLCRPRRAMIQTMIRGLVAHCRDAHPRDVGRCDHYHTNNPAAGVTNRDACGLTFVCTATGEATTFHLWVGDTNTFQKSLGATIEHGAGNTYSGGVYERGSLAHQFSVAFYYLAGGAAGRRRTRRRRPGCRL
jgi:hypothetical protein